MQYLRHIDPDSIVLNFLESDNPKLDAESSEISEGTKDFSDEISYQYDHKRTDLFVFAAYVPPGKHCILVRDTESNLYD